MVKVSVLTITWRPGYIDSMVDSLQKQTMPKGEFEFILVDDLWEVRNSGVKAYIGDSLNIQHLPPREIKDYSATAIAVNTGLASCKGELVYFMADYMYLHPFCLQRHWEIYQKYGPKVIISGSLIDNLTLHGRSLWAGARPEINTVKVGDKIIKFPDHIPPVPWSYQEPPDKPSAENLITIWSKPFLPTWPRPLSADWRLGVISNISLDRNLYECVPGWLSPDGSMSAGPKWWWAGRNDSAPLEALKSIGGMPESEDMKHEGMDAEMAEKMLALGCRYLVDREAPAIILPHPVRKPEVGNYPTATQIS